MTRSGFEKKMKIVILTANRDLDGFPAIAFSILKLINA